MCERSRSRLEGGLAGGGAKAPAKRKHLFKRFASRRHCFLQIQRKEVLFPGRGDTGSWWRLPRWLWGAGGPVRSRQKVGRQVWLPSGFAPAVLAAGRWEVGLCLQRGHCAPHSGKRSESPDSVPRHAASLLAVPMTHSPRTFHCHRSSQRRRGCAAGPACAGG